MTVRPLVNRCPLRPGESLPSLLERLRQANYYESKMAVISLCRSHMPQTDNVFVPQQPATWSILATLTGLAPETLYAATLHPCASILALPSETISYVMLADSSRPLLTPHGQRTYLLPLNDAQFCPACLQADSYHRAAWLNGLVAICPEHNCLLQRGCLHCHQKVTVAAIVAGRCPHCEIDLSASVAVDLSQDHWGVWVQQKMQSWWQTAPAPAMPESVTLPEHPIPVLLETLRGLVQAVTHWKGNMSQQRKHPPPEQIFRDYAIAMKAMTNWPQEFHQFLVAYGRRPGVTKGQITVVFRPLYMSWLEKRWAGPEFTFIQEAFDEFLATHYPLSRPITRLDRYRRDIALRNRFPYLTQAEAAERLNVVPQVIERLIAIEMLVSYERGEQTQLHWHRRLRLVRRLEFDSLQKRWQEGIAMNDVTQLLDVKASLVVSLVEAKLLTWQSETDGQNAAWTITPESLSHLFDKLHCYPNSFWQLMEKVALQQLVESGFDVITVLQHIIDGELTSLWFRGGLYSVQVSQQVWEKIPGHS